MGGCGRSGDDSEYGGKEGGITSPAALRSIHHCEIIFYLRVWATFSLPSGNLLLVASRIFLVVSDMKIEQATRSQD